MVDKQTVQNKIPDIFWTVISMGCGLLFMHFGNKIVSRCIFERCVVTNSNKSSDHKRDWHSPFRLVCTTEFFAYAEFQA